MKSNTLNSTEKNIRIHHHRLDKEYSILPNHGAENDKLSWAAKGLLWYMISRESTFEIHSWHLASLHKGPKRGGGIAGIRVMLDELKKEGYLIHHKYQNKQGHWEHRYDLYPIPAEDFQKMFPERVKPYTVEPSTVKPDVLPITELPITDLDPPLSSPPKKKSSEKKVSLRSEEEEIVIYKILEETKLSPKDKKRVSKEYKEAEVERALKIAKTQPVKKSFMGLLLNILNNPDNWGDQVPKTQPRAKETEIDLESNTRLANQYNEKLKTAEKQIVNVKSLEKKGGFNIDLSKVAQRNETTLIEQNLIHLINDGYLSKISLYSPYFEQDIKNAIAQLR